jgi:hypothetical protein
VTITVRKEQPGNGLGTSAAAQKDRWSTPRARRVTQLAAALRLSLELGLRVSVLRAPLSATAELARPARPGAQRTPAAVVDALAEHRRRDLAVHQGDGRAGHGRDALVVAAGHLALVRVVTHLFPSARGEAPRVGRAVNAACDAALTHLTTDHRLESVGRTRDGRLLGDRGRFWLRKGARVRLAPIAANHSIAVTLRIPRVGLERRAGVQLRWLTLIAAVGCVLLPGASATASTPAVSAPRPSLTALWWKAEVAVPDAASRCDLGIDKIVFLGATTGGSASRSCALLAGTSVLVPLINIECSSLEPSPFFGATPAERRACAEGFAADFTDLFLTINGVPVGDLSRHRVQSQPFGFSPVAGNTFGIPPGTGGSVSDGYWALLDPLAPGTYDVAFGGAYQPDPAQPPLFSTDTTYHLRVVSMQVSRRSLLSE